MDEVAADRARAAAEARLAEVDARRGRERVALRVEWEFQNFKGKRGVPEFQSRAQFGASSLIKPNIDP